MTLLEWNHDNDHVHALLTGTPDTRLSVFIGIY
ncbi:MAG: transposase [Deltaproteobacteria bacterium]|jgi:REP element-mobilizing transposase RayT|nr:transposase [Deltaproteobacteria bacterium]